MATLPADFVGRWRAHAASAGAVEPATIGLGAATLAILVFRPRVSRRLPGPFVALMATVGSLLSAVVADGMIGGRHRSNMELVAQGIANTTSPIFGGIPATGAIARTATNVKNGARSSPRPGAISPCSSPPSS